MDNKRFNKRERGEEKPAQKPIDEKTEDSPDDIWGMDDNAGKKGGLSNINSRLGGLIKNIKPKGRHSRGEENFSDFDDLGGQSNAGGFDFSKIANKAVSDIDENGGFDDVIMDFEQGQTDPQGLNNENPYEARPIIKAPKQDGTPPASRERSKPSNIRQSAYSQNPSPNADLSAHKASQPPFDEQNKQKAAQKRHSFNVAAQPSYLTQAQTAEGEAERIEKGGKNPFGKIGALFGKLKKDDDGATYYTPPESRSTQGRRRTRYKRRNKKPIPLWARIAMTSLSMCLLFLLLITVAFTGLMGGRVNNAGDTKRHDIRLTAEEQTNLSADLTNIEENPAEFTEPMRITGKNNDIKVIMIVSSDARLGAEKQTSARTDAITLVAIDHQNKRIRLASIMTDVYVRIKDYYSNRLSKAYYYDTANGDFSLPRLHQTIKDNFGIVPDNFIVVDFTAFQKMVSKVGGVTIDVSVQEAYYMSNHPRYGRFPRFNASGSYVMTGSEALNYVRMRAVGSDDFDRVQRQRNVYLQITEAIKGMSFIELSQFAYGMLPELPTNLTKAQLLSLFMKAKDMADYEINELTLPVTGSWRYGTANVRDNEFTVLVTNFEFNADVLQKYLYNNDDSYLNGKAAVGITIPADIAPLADDSPAGEAAEANENNSDSQ